MKTKNSTPKHSGLALRLILILLAVATGLDAQTIPNSGFEIPDVGPVGNYYSFQYNASGADWTFLGNSGIAANGSGFAFYNAGTPDGNQFAFLQVYQGAGGSMYQIISNLPAGNYTFSFIASQRDVVGRDVTVNQTVVVLVDGTNAGSFTPPDPNWYSYSTTPISLAAGNHVLTLTNLPVAGDGTVRVDMMTITGSYSSPYTVDWFKVAGGGGTSTNGAYSVTGTFGQPDAGGPMGGGGFTVEGGFWSLYGVQSSSVTGNAPVITSQPQSVFVSNGAPAYFSVTVSGTPPLFYQWQKNAINLTDAGNVSGSTTANLALNTISTNDAGDYTIIAKNAYSSATSSVAKLTIILPFTMTTLITFDELPDTTGGIMVTNGYYGLSWSNFYELDGVNAFGNDESGYAAGVVSPRNVAYNAFGDPAYISSIRPFGFVSAYLTAAWNDNLQVEVAGYSGAAVIYDNTYTLSATTPTLINFNYSGVTGVYFYSFGGTPHSAYPDAGEGAEHFAMDNVSIASNPVVNFPPKFQKMTVTGGNMTFSWNTVNTFPPVGYQVQYTTNLSASNWLNLGTVLTGAGPTISATDTNITDAERFYRVLLVQ